MCDLLWLMTYDYDMYYTPLPYRIGLMLVLWLSHGMWKCESMLQTLLFWRQSSHRWERFLNCMGCNTVITLSKRQETKTFINVLAFIACSSIVEPRVERIMVKQQQSLLTLSMVQIHISLILFLTVTEHHVYDKMIDLIDKWG